MLLCFELSFFTYNIIPNMTEEVDSKWTKLTLFAEDDKLSVQKVFALNECMLIVLASNIIFTYNIRTNTLLKFREIKEVPSYILNSSGSISFNKAKQEMYFHKATKHEMHVISIKTKEHYIIDNVPFGEYYCCINDHLHIIRNDERHWIGSIEISF